MTRWVGTSWKMHHTLSSGTAYARELARAAAQGRWPGLQPFVLPPATALAAVAHELRGSGVRVGAQNAHWADEGAWTGELSVPQLADAGATVVELGHSERRAHFAETDRTVNRKVHAVLRHGLTPLVCVGEDAQDRAAGRATAVVSAQVAAALDGVADRSSVLLAYEPVWAIGVDGRPAAPEEVADVHAALAATYPEVLGVLYGGSVHPGNARDLLAVPGVDGLFIGRAAWQVSDYLAMLDLCVATDS